MKASRPRDRRETEARLFEAGVKVMSAVGYDAATTKVIAAAAGVNEQLISRYFGGKEGLLVAILEDYNASELKRELEARPDASTLEEEIANFLLEADFSDEREPFARLALGRAVVDDKVAQAINQLRRACYQPLLTERLKVHQARGSIDRAVALEPMIDALIHARLGLAAYGRLLFHLGSPQLRRLCGVYAKVFARALAAPEKVTAAVRSPAKAKRPQESARRRRS